MELYIYLYRYTIQNQKQSKSFLEYCNYSYIIIIISYITAFIVT